MARSLADDDAVPNGWRTRQPGCAIWVIIAIFRGLLEAVFYSIYYIPSFLRQSPRWTYREAYTTRLFKGCFRIITEIGFTQSLSLEPGKLGDRWVTIDPAPASAYCGDFTSDTIKPETVGGTWYPKLPSKQSLLEEQGLVVLSFHSGSLLTYRLAGGSNPTPYPGAMQDAVTAYIYLIKEMGISPSRIILAGDSTGSTIAVALLRYLVSIKDVQDHELAHLPPPKACFLFSPSVEYCFEGDPEAVSANRNIKTDYVEARLSRPPETVRLDDPYISPALHPFATPVPIFIQAGGVEVLCDSVRGFFNAMSAIPGNVAEHFEVPDVPHDIYVVGHLLGWPKEQEDIHEAAARFVLQ
ncbi:Alpha/beta hydrolase fold-3 [Penicillium cinerascens]|uniref:Alpha/beta hydrolase fold-3 n=1 Tax=Penicillium cinerascens TaxID=70096 RepID=A0A9W9ND12_9EURO|nr:Alpha/beta hydrolase fold-3 [Penicillium cinerascens]KAJ5216608.1 Alpha/beta hydrolase fold-3 [Penicillium cinerascens]